MANNSGIGISNFAFEGGTATLEISNTILANNAGNNIQNSQVGTGVANFVSSGNNISDDAVPELNGSSDLTNTNPLIGALADNGGPAFTHALLAGSPAIDAGDNARAIDSAANAFVNDQRQGPFRRFYDADNDGTATVDIGAFEYYGELFVSTNSDVVDTDHSAGQFSLREAIAVSEAQSGADTISFASSLNGQTITLGGSELRVIDSLAINGPGAGNLTISGGNSSRLFWFSRTGGHPPTQSAA